MQRYLSSISPHLHKQLTNTPRILSTFSPHRRTFTHHSKTSQHDHNSSDYFKLLNIHPPRFLLNSTILETAYKTLQRLWHPDLHSTRPITEQTQASNMSALINQAYQTLRTPHLRAKYMLKQRGHNLDDDHKVAANIEQDESFLMRMVEMREKIATADVDALKNLDRENQRELDACYKELDVAFENNDVDKAKALVVKLQYLRRIARNVHERLPTQPHG